MDLIEFTCLLFLGALIAGFLGALSGLGGGVITIPLFTIAFNINIHYAMGASLIGIIATSLGASSALLKSGYTNLRAASFFQTATVIGALIGVTITSHLSSSTIHIVFGLLLISSALIRYIKINPSTQTSSKLMKLLHITTNPNGVIPDNDKEPTRPILSYVILIFAGGFSGLLGIGSGSINVLALEKIMGFPFKIATATSNFMIGITASASAGLFLKMGYISPVTVLAAVPGVLIGSFFGAKIIKYIPNKHLQILFTIMVTLIGSEMIFRGVYLEPV